MADLLSRLLSFPSPSTAAFEDAYSLHARDFIASVNELLPAAIDGAAAKLDAILEHVDPSIHSLPYLLVLHFHGKTVEKNSHTILAGDSRPGGSFWTRCLLFLRTFDPTQVRHAMKEWHKLVGTYSLALPVIDQTICQFSATYDKPNSQQNESDIDLTTDLHLFGPRSSLSHKDHLQYFLYGGMIYMALKKWNKARHFLSIVISSPAVNSVSLIMVEAYKKWVLVNLLEKGVVAPLPKATPPISIKLYKALAKPYDALASTFVAGDGEKLWAEVEFGHSIWRMDKNTGLVQQVLLAFRKQSVLRLSSTFAAVTTTDVSKRALSGTMDTDATERYILSLAIQKQLSASLSHLPGESKPSMLRFSTAGNTQSTELEADLEGRLLLQQQKLNLLVQNIRTSDRKLELGKEYLEYLRRGQKHNDSMSKEGNQSGRTKGQDIDPDLDFDEDMMGDMH
ncbi:COP9 signalosome complex subunit 3 [Talaromyces islandicus]|uniref:COP9 signalosome complex subunit 3 n=1 Tax=Talaromyces islandicus TaxID=28573 RepID=A0A0U1LNS0_TALIS|nr:COP9 signalosome complex subunit 3 [Talaromyces islandicus]